MGKQDECIEASRVEPYIEKTISKIQTGDLVVNVNKINLSIFNGQNEFFISTDNGVLEDMVRAYVKKNIAGIMGEAFELLKTRNINLLAEAKQEAKCFLETTQNQ